MVVLNHLEPQRVFHFFEELCAIPHGSGNTKAVSDWLVDFAKARGLRYVQDQLNNVVIFQDAAPGYESAEPVILQGHMDMVCEKEPGCTKDMAVEGLDLVLEGDTVSAGQTLVVLEAMKMENNIDAERGGKVKSVMVQQGATVMEGDVLIVIE